MKQDVASSYHHDGSFFALDCAWETSGYQTKQY